MKSLEKYLLAPPLLSSAAKAVWQGIEASRDIFSKNVTPYPFNHREVGVKDPPFWAEIEGLKAPYLPISTFRRTDHGYFAGPEITKVFRSSGTSDIHRSHSRFSKDGLTLYQAASLKTFHRVLADFYGDDAGSAQGISLIPTGTEWPGSSLAQMLSWFGEFWPVTFTNVAEFRNVSRGLDQTKPVWIFATTYQLLQLFDDGNPYELPANSLVIETGGMKSFGQDLNRNDLYELISRHFLIPQNRIISEYSMSELACQAYDWQPEQNASTARAFRLPNWVTTKVMPSLALVQSSGEGSLAFFDPCRIDYPWLIRTQDLGNLASNGSFQLLGRATLAPLKGCSLSSAELLISTQNAKASLAPRNFAVHVLEKELIEKRAAIFSRKFFEFCHDLESIAALGEELGSNEAAKVALAGCLKSLPKTKSSWLDAARTAMTANEFWQSSCPKKWLALLPANHPIVGFYPLAVAYVCGLSIDVRLPSLYFSKPNLLSKYLDMLKGLEGNQLKILSPKFRIAKNTNTFDYEAIIAYGESSTLAAIEQSSDTPVVGFGGAIAVAFVDAETDLDPVVKDTFELAQRGCMSPRMICVFTKDEFDEKLFAQRFNESFEKFWGEGFDANTRQALDEELLVFQGRLNARAFRPSLNSPLMIFCANKDEIGDISRMPFVLPVSTIKGSIVSQIEATIAQLCSRYPELRYIALPAGIIRKTELVSFLNQRFKGIIFQEVGSLGALSWNGTHEQRALFNPYRHQRAVAPSLS